MTHIKSLLIILVGILFTVSCGNPTESQKESDQALSIAFEKYTLENGLDVVLHQDMSDPIVSVAIRYHVGSNREKPGRTGFAHLFEHMLFQESENVEQDQFFKKIQDAGGILNGGTWYDGTVYFEVVPKNALEMVMWLESDRMGYLINTVTEEAFANQQNVVQNEKRERVDNRPYGHTNYVIHKNLFPKDHPYNWQVIGEFEDLKNATVEDVKEFYHQYYGPNNATLVIAGDLNIEETKAYVEKYFGELKRGQEVPALLPQNVKLTESKRLYHEDNFATAPQLSMVWPTVEMFHKDAYALDFLADLLTKGKKAAFFKKMVKEKKFTSNTSAWNEAHEIAGKFTIRINANNDIPLDSIESGIIDSFKLFEETGITDLDIERIKASLETQFYQGISSVFNKATQLSYYNVFANDPSFITQDIENIKAVTKEDVMAVYEKYIKGKPFILTSFVPKGKTDLMASNSEVAQVVEEDINNEETNTDGNTDSEEIKKTASLIDRSIEPDKTEQPPLSLPEQWEAVLNNGIRVFGIEQNELPLISFSMVIDGGKRMDNIDNIGIANIMTDIMMEGTKNKTPEELEEEIELLGASIYMGTSNEYISISATCLSRNFEKTIALVEEILLEPRWDTVEFELQKTSTINAIKRNAGNPNSVAGTNYNKLLYGDEHILAYHQYGDPNNVQNFTTDDLKDFYNRAFAPNIARAHFVGDVSQARVLQALESINNRWAKKEVKVPQYELPSNPDNAKLYFIDFPNAKQSIIKIGYLALARSDPDYYPTKVMNYKLGGSFSGNVNLILREEKGYTYGARTYFGGSKEKGAFTASASVRTNTTFESVKIFKEEMEKYKEGISEDDLLFTKNAMIKSNARAFETLGSLMGVLRTRSAYNLPKDYIAKEESIIRNMTLEEHKKLAQKYLNPDRMFYLVAGDAATQYEQFKEAGFEKLILLDKEGTPIDIPIEGSIAK